MSGIDQQGNVILPSGAVYNPQAAVQETLSNIYGMSQGIPYIPMPQYQPSAEFGVNRFLAGDQAMPLVYDISAPQYTPTYEPFIFKPQSWADYMESQNPKRGGGDSSSSDSGPTFSTFV